jgi:hypothetical protein
MVIISDNMNDTVKKIMRNINCRNNYQCYYKGLDNFKKINSDQYPNICEALTKDAKYCEYSIPFGHKFFCHCPLIKYLKQNNKKTLIKMR